MVIEAVPVGSVAGASPVSTMTTTPAAAAMFFDRGILLVRECLLRIQRMLILQSTVLICFIVGEF